MMSGPATPSLSQSASRVLLSLVVTERRSSWSVNIREPLIRVGWALALERSLPLNNNFK